MNCLYCFSSIFAVHVPPCPVLEIALNTYPPSTAVQDSPPSPFKAITPSPPLSSPTRLSPVAEPTMHVYQLSDFKDFTYRGKLRACTNINNNPGTVHITVCTI